MRFVFKPGNKFNAELLESGITALCGKSKSARIAKGCFGEQKCIEWIWFQENVPFNINLRIFKSGRCVIYSNVLTDLFEAWRTGRQPNAKTTKDQATHDI